MPPPPRHRFREDREDMDMDEADLEELSLQIATLQKQIHQIDQRLKEGLQAKPTGGANPVPLEEWWKAVSALREVRQQLEAVITQNLRFYQTVEAILASLEGQLLRQRTCYWFQWCLLALLALSLIGHYIFVGGSSAGPNLKPQYPVLQPHQRSRESLPAWRG